MAKNPTNAELAEMIGQLQGQVRQLTSLVSAHNGVQPLDELQIVGVARDFAKRGPEAIAEWNQTRKAQKRRTQRRAG